ncbi:MAG: nucleotidyltransferase domain-containing protein [Candidatus Korarchaeum sp.]
MSRGFLRRRADEERRKSSMLREISSRYDGLTVMLFGSRARGEHTAASDYDLIVIYDDPDELRGFKKELKKERIPADLHCFTLREAIELLRSSTVLLDALEEGIVLREGIALEPLREEMGRLKGKGYRRVKGGWIIPSAD